MTTTYPDSTITEPSTNLKALLIEPFLVVGVSAFWAVTLPLAAVSMLGIKAWDTVGAIARRSSRSNPLILRRTEIPKASLSQPQAAKKA